MPSKRELANAIRVLSMDAIEKSRSGHPGAPLGMADIAEVLWNDFLKHNPANPNWLDRDRFVLSNGHGSMLIYSLLHLTGYDLGIEDIKNFRQLHSKTPGHPEYGVTPGVETTTGPLGQGVANAVGMALAERILAERFNREGFDIVDHHTYALMGDGCMMEGLSHEACSLAGTLGLGKLIALWDDNGISIDGDVKGWFSEDTPARFRSYGWHVIENVDGHDSDQIAKALRQAREEKDRPSLICCRTTIGFGAPNLCGSHECHGAPLGEEEIAKARRFLGWEYDPFVIPDNIYAAWNAREKGGKAESEWRALFQAYMKKHPDLADEYIRRMAGETPEGFESQADEFIRAMALKGQTLATRVASKQVIESFGPLLPEFLGGSADLTGSNLTNWSGSKTITAANKDGNYISYGVREFAMAAMMNGMALHGGFIPYGGTFLVFSDYSRNALRMAALMGLRVVHVLTHDSIGVGEDGPTHQPVEHTASLRLIPNMSVWRPCDTVETAAAWKSAVMSKTGPSCLVLSRQNLQHQDRSQRTTEMIERGGYILRDCEDDPEAVIMACGSEVQTAVAAAETLSGRGRRVRVVSMPCADIFDKQDQDYKDAVLPRNGAAMAAVEAGVGEGWRKYIGRDGETVCMDRFGESAPGGVLFEYFGLTPDRVVSAVENALEKKERRLVETLERTLKKAVKGNSDKQSA